MTESEQALQILRKAASELESLWDYTPGRPLGWLNRVVDGLLEELEWKARNG